jgi:hypothetical protein
LARVWIAVDRQVEGRRVERVAICILTILTIFTAKEIFPSS